MKKKAPKLRAWGKPHRKVMTMVIPSKKEKLKKRTRQKEIVRKIIKNNFS